MTSDTGIAEKQYALIRKLTTVDDEHLLDEVGRFIDDSRSQGSLRRLEDAEMEAVLRQLLDGDLEAW